MIKEWEIEVEKAAKRKEEWYEMKNAFIYANIIVEKLLYNQYSVAI